MAAHTALGYLLAVGLAGAARASDLGRGAARARCSGSCVSTAARWRSTARSIGTKATSPTCGDPPPPPRAAGRVLPRPHGGWAARRAGAAAARSARLYAVCFVLSVLYSVPPFRLKAVAGADWLINMWGFGTLTPLRRLGGDRAAARDRPGHRPARLLPALRRALSAHPALSARGGRTTRRPDTRPDARDPREASTWRSPRPRWRSLLFVWAGARSAWTPGAAGWRWSLLLIALLVWAAVLVPWRRAAERLPAPGPPARHVPRARRMGGDRPGGAAGLGHLTPWPAPAPSPYTSPRPTSFRRRHGLRRRSCTATTT